MIQSGRFLRNMLGNLGKTPGFVKNLASIAINKFERILGEKGALRAGKGFKRICFKWRYEKHLFRMKIWMILFKS